MKSWKKKITAALIAAAAVCLGTASGAGAAKDYHEKVKTPSFKKTITVKAKGTAAKMTAAVQDALDEAGESGMIKVKLVGNFKIDGILYITSNTYLDTTEATVTRVYSGGDKRVNTLMNKGNGSGSNGKYNLTHDIWIVGGTWSGGDLSKATTGTNICLGHARNVFILDVDLMNNYGGHLVELNAVSDALVQDCTFNNYKAKAKDKMALQLDIAHRGSGDHDTMASSFQADDTPCRNIRLICNKFNNKNTKYSRYDRAFGSDMILTDKGIYHKNIKFYGNEVSKCGGNGITVHGFSDFKVMGNKVSGAGDNGITVKCCKNGTIGSNTVSKSGLSGILVYNHMSKVTVTGNTIKDSKKQGISCHADKKGKMSGVKFTKNKISTSSGAKAKPGIGIYVSKKAVVDEISGNTITSVKDYGISVNNATVKTISGNTVKKSKKVAIMVTNKGQVTNIKNNTVTSPKANGIYVNDKGACAKNITGNTVTGAAGHGIYVRSCKAVSSISSNKVKNCKGYGIGVYGAKVSAIQSNQLTKNGTGLYISSNSKVSKKSKNKIK